MPGYPPAAFAWDASPTITIATTMSCRVHDVRHNQRFLDGPRRGFRRRLCPVHRSRTGRHASTAALQQRLAKKRTHPIVRMKWSEAEAFCRWAGRTAADRSRMGIRRPRRPSRSEISMGQPPHPRKRELPRHRLAGRLEQYFAAQELPAEPLGSVRYGGRRLGMAGRLVCRRTTTSTLRRKIRAEPPGGHRARGTRRVMVYDMACAAQLRPLQGHLRIPTATTSVSAVSARHCPNPPPPTRNNEQPCRPPAFRFLTTPLP